MSDILELKDEFISLHSDFSVVAPVYRTAMFLSQHTPVYFYTFEYEGELSFSEYLLQPSNELRERRAEVEGEKENITRSKRQQSSYNELVKVENNATSVGSQLSPEDFDVSDDRRK